MTWNVRTGGKRHAGPWRPRLIDTPCLPSGVHVLSECSRARAFWTWQVLAFFPHKQHTCTRTTQLPDAPGGKGLLALECLRLGAGQAVVVVATLPITAAGSVSLANMGAVPP